ncbi:MAG TPA: NHLP-related RiPP peptide [Rudaea sp.]|nr:NHLP-related RiPP peptide [Rudaea sp.]
MAGSKLAPDVVDKLLDKLGSDDAFRGHFEKDPKAALQTLGAPADVECGGCVKPKRLASKEHMRKAREQIRGNLLGKTSQTVFALEAS